MTSRRFEQVWFLPAENTWRDFQILAFRDTGVLTLQENALEFCGAKGTVVITDVHHVSYGKQGRDFINNWVKIEYGDPASPSEAFFADGSLLGWGGILGGTKKILAAVGGLRAKGLSGSSVRKNLAN
jgi:hypothetical protein